MKKQKKQNLLNIIIVMLVLALIVMVGSIVYEEITNMSNKPTENVGSPSLNDDKEQGDENDSILDNKEETPDGEAEEEEKNDENESLEEPTTNNKEEYIGEEETTSSQEPAKSKDEKAIDLAKKEWGNDNSVTFNIEQKNGSKYYVVVRSETKNALQWYEVDTETWKISEF